ncbi:MAG: tRNA pseudouridine(55) synthase TruB [Bacteroidales bacterium]|nr:MAG: tRNA pseudouridine(55) synthase TruB [Bacteroidales bacterium]
MIPGFTKDTDFQEGAILLINKPYGWTSFNVVSKIKHLIRKAKGYKKLKVGHAGTLDPLATGLLVICVGRATKQVESFLKDDKEYIATFRLGQTTPSFDMETQMNQEFSIEHITSELVDKVVRSFLGEQNQIPPLFSAKSVNGTRAYDLARRGVDMELAAVKIYFHELEVIKFELPDLTLRIKCSKGTYIRSLARDLGKALNSGAYLADLVRTGSGIFKLADAKGLDEFEKNFMANVTN